jgi:uncharacterized protein YhjY with autotransporter beta-barrel domain
VSASVNISAGVSANGDAKVNVTGGAVSDARVRAEASVSAIRGGSGDDEVINAGDFVDIGSVAETTSVAASLEVTGALAFKGDADASTSGSAVSVSSADALTRTVAIDGGVGNDIIGNTGNILNLESDSKATSVSAGANVSAVVTIKGNAEADVTGEAVGDSRVTAQATALGIDGGLGDDTIDNEGDMRLLSTADATGVSAELNVSAALSFKGASTADVSGGAASNSSVLATAEATGIDGGWGQDTIRNSGDLTLMNEDVVDADALGVSASLNVSGNVAIKGVAAGTVKGAAASNATVTAEATATGIDGGGDNDIIDNTGAIKLLPSSNADGIAASLNVSGNMVGETEGSAMSDASVTARSIATGIGGGEGDDTIVNKGAITLMKQEVGEDEVDAEALGVAASLDITGNLNGTAEGQALSKATTTAEATATGISGAAGVDTITNTAGITADVDSDAEGVSIAAEVSVAFNGTAEGSSLSDASTSAKAKAAGIEAGEDDDIIDNSGVIQLSSDADATSTAISLTVSGALRGQAGGEALSKASTTADATATGIDGGEGLDEITNLGLISADATATTDAVAVAGGLSFTLAGTAEGAALSDLSSTSFARAMGIDGGGDDDIIDNEGAMNVSSLADAQATAVSVGLTGAMKGLAEGKSVADSSAEAIAQSIGIDGGEGNDRISSSANPITVFARSLSDAESVSVQGTGAVGMAKGAAVADSSASSVSYSAGIDGGLGNDTIENASEIKSTAKADAEATSTTVGVTIGLGAAETIGTGDSSATARANSTGIEGGEGNDRIINTAKITTGGLETMGPMASAQAGATSVTVGIAAGLNMSKASSNAAAIAEANTAGISGGSGDDWIYNTGDIMVGPDPNGTGSMASASAKSTTVKVDVTLGASLGESSSDTSSTAVANLAGISGGSGNDAVYNSGSITVGRYFSDSVKPDDAMATANAGSETVDVGLTIGGSFSDASSNASATAHSKATGIETGLGADVVNNTGVINTFSSSEALSTAEAIKVTLTIGALKGAVESDASTLSTALATGIDSGEEADQIDTDGDFVVKALSTSTTTSKAEDLNVLSIGSAIQSATANSSSTAEAFARGIDGGTGADTITAAGNYEVSADTELSSTSRSSTVTGLSIGGNQQKAQALAETTAQALAVCIDGGEGDDVINSTATLTVNTFSNASTTGVSATNSGFNIAGASSVESVAGAATNVTATGIGIRGGPSELAANQTDTDVIINEGPISVTTTVSATTQSTSTAKSTTFIGAAEGKAVSDASARVLAEGIGIDSGADNDTITNKNTLTVKTKADSSVKSTSNVDSDVTFGGASSIGVSDASANVWAEATGMAGGSGDDVITSLAPVTVEAESIGSVTANSYVDAEVTFGGASSKAASDASATKKGMARGIDGGDGDDVIANYDSLNVRAISAGTVTSESRAKAKAIFGSSSSMTTTAAALEGAVDAAGIIGGSGDDWIKNLGNVNSTAHAELTVNSVSMATAKSTFGSSDARAFSVSTAQGKASSIGISGNDGKELIENEGVVNASAIANTNIKSATVAIARSTFGGESTEAASTNYAAGESTSKGITAGAGEDTIANKGLVTVEVGGTVKVDSLTVSSSGPAYSDAGTLALAYARGVDGAAGDDGILNTDTVFVKAKPNISSATRTFGSGGNVDGKVGILLNAVATGITGGEGNDQISNEGNVPVFVGVQDTKSTVSENAVSGSTTITDNSFTTPADPKDLVGKWIRITGGENPDFFTQVVDFDPDAGTFTLSDPLKYDLSKNTQYILYDYGGKTPDITSLNVTAGGRTRVDASTTASVQAKGIVGGDGDDQIVNAGRTAVSASNLVKTVTLSFTRNIRADTRIESNVNAVGIEGNDQSSATDVSDGGTKVFTDLSRKGEDPDAIVGKPILFKSGSSADFATLVTEFDPDTGTFTLADPLPSGGLMRGDIYTLGEGSDSITNMGAIGVEADSAIDASSWSFSYRGADIEVKGQAQALSAGMRGGEFDDSFQNLGPIVTRSTADVSSTERVMVKFGEKAEQKLTFEASSSSVGVDAGDGNDEFTNAKNGSIDAEAISTANIEGGVTTTYGAYWLPDPSESKTINLADALAQSTAVAIDIGAGHDVTSNEGVLQVSANAVATAKAISDYTFYNETDADADAIAKASAWGIKAGSGGDQVLNRNLIQVDASADATSFAQGAKVGSKDDMSTVTEDSSAGLTTFVDASLIPEEGQAPPDLVGKWVRFLTGENEDFFTRIVGFDPSTGTITIFDELPGDLKAADLYTFSAARNGTSASVASAIAVGIDVGDGNAVVENTGVIRVKAFAKADTTAKTFGGQATAQANSSSKAGGIRTGTGDDVIRNAGIIDVESEVVTTTSDGSTTEIATATGIDAGDGINILQSQSSISVVANAISGISAEAEVWGIKTGSSSDGIALETGSLITTAAHATSSSSNGVTKASAIGIDAGDGANQITNYGLVLINANATAEVKREEIEIIGRSITYPATANSSVTGLKSGNEVDIINNYGEINVNSEAMAVINQVLDRSAGTKSATANAIGIDAGDGDNFVANYGTVDVGALAAAGTGANPNARTDGVENTTAIGIMTGDGDDTIINSGTINAANQRLEWVGGWIHITSQQGIGISSGGGKDKLFLTNGSVTSGHIDLGDGDDWLTFMGTSLVTGDVTGAAGMDTLVFDGAGSIGFTPMAFENAIKQGSGTYSVPSLPTMQRIEIKEGILEVNDNYQFSNNGSFETFVKGDGGFGQFKVNGTTELAGDLNVLKGPGPYIDGTTYDIIEANAVNDAFSNVTLPDPNNFVSFEMNQFPTLVQIEVNVKDFTWLARNRVEWAVANYLDRILPSATGDLFGVLGQIQHLSQSEYSTALSSLSPDSYDNFTRTTLSTTHRYTKSLQYRMNNIRSFLHANGSANEPPILLAYRDSDWGQLLNPERVSQIQGRNGLWLDAFGQWGDQSEESRYHWNGGYVGYDYFMRGATLGLDHVLNDNFTAGISVGYSRSDIDLDHGQGSGYIKNLLGSIYGSYLNKNLYIDGALSYGKNWYDNHRLITIGPIRRKAYSDHDGDLFSAYLGAGYHFDIKKWLIGPFASLQYTYLDEESFREKGTDSLSLRIDDRQTDSFISELGLRLARVFKVKYGSLIPELNAAWLLDFDIDDRVIKSSFAGSPGATFSIKGQDVERNGASLGAGIIFVHKSGLSTSLKYRGEFRKKYKSNGVMGEIRLTF